MSAHGCPTCKRNPHCHCGHSPMGNVFGGGVAGTASSYSKGNVRWGNTEESAVENKGHPGDPTRVAIATVAAYLFITGGFNVVTDTFSSIGGMFSPKDEMSGSFPVDSEVKV